MALTQVGRIDREKLIKEHPLDLVVEQSWGAPVKHSGRWIFWICQFHDDGHRPSFGVTPDDGRYKCFGCGESGNVIDFVIKRDNLPAHDIQGAAAALGAEPVDVSKSATRNKHNVKRTNEPPGPVWQDRALDLVYTCRSLLHSPEGEKALAYLHKRGFVDDTIWEWCLGFQPETRRFEELADWGIEPPNDGKRHAMWVPRGITIPCFAAEGELLHYVKVRRAVQDQHGEKYVKLAVPRGASAAGLYGADQAAGNQVQVLVLDEGEFNALIVWQEAGDLVDAMSTGSASTRPETLQLFWGVLMGYAPILARFDPDKAGKISTAAWGAFSERLRLVQTPSEKDPNDYFKKGGSVRDWIGFELARMGLG